MRNSKFKIAIQNAKFLALVIAIPIRQLAERGKQSLPEIAAPRSAGLAMTKESGFTIIELLIAISIIAAVSTIGISSFLSYSRSQTLNTAMLDVKNMLETARSRALTQIKPAGAPCSTLSLKGYRVEIDGNQSKSYHLYAVCVAASGSESQDATENVDKQLPSALSFANLLPINLTFRILSGGVDGAVSGGTLIEIRGYNSTKTIRVYPDGRITHD